MNLMKNVKRGVTARLAAAVLVATAASCASGQSVQVSLNVRPELIQFNPNDPPVYVLFVTLHASGFVDDSNPENSVVITSSASTFSGEWTTNGGGASSGGYANLVDLVTEISAQSSWRMEVSDGETGMMGTYEFTLDAPSGIDQDYLRPITVDQAPNVTISASPTFDFSIDSASFPESEYESGGAGMYANNWANSQFGSMLPGDTSWSPPMLLVDDLYLLDLRFTNDATDSTDIYVTSPVYISGDDIVGGIDYVVNFSTETQVPGLRVGEPPTLSVTYRPELAVLKFSPEDSPFNCLFGGITASGFTNEGHFDNHVQLVANSGFFACDAFPAQGSGGASSVGGIDTDTLEGYINGDTQWLLRITDGATANVYEYNVTVAVNDIPEESMRPLNIDLYTGQALSTNPTITFNLDSAINPEFEYESAGAGLHRNNNSSYTTPALDPSDRSWTPDGPLDPDTYFLIISMRNDDLPTTIFDIVGATGVTGTEPELTFNVSAPSSYTYSQVNELVVSDQYCPADFNLDGGIDGSDVEAFFDAWVVADPSADTNLDGGVDGGDVEAFFTAWSNGGC